MAADQNGERATPGLRSGFIAIARGMGEASGGRLAIVFGEADDSAASESEAAHFLKIDGRRHGRDIEVYAFLAKLEGEPAALVRFVEELVLPLEGVPASHAVGLQGAEALGPRFFEDETLLAEWAGLLRSLATTEVRDGDEEPNGGR